MTREEMALKPCPFCGADDAEYGYVDDEESPDHGGHFIQCPHARCGASVGLIFNNGEDPKPLLVERWNRRAGLHPSASGEGVKGDVYDVLWDLVAAHAQADSPVKMARVAEADKAARALLAGRKP